jgi:site-specific DNA recombinase
MKTAFTYHRYSRESQRDGYTLEAQRRITKEIADKYQAKIIGSYEDEAISAATIEKRPSILQLLEDLVQLKPSYIISTDQDRLSRSNDFWTIKNILAKTKTSIITEKEGLLDFNDETKDALSDVINVFSKLERKLIGRRIKRALDQRAENGLVVANLRRIYGYDYSNGNIAINEYEAEVIKKIYDFYLSGKGLDWIARYLNGGGTMTKAGGRFHRSTIREILSRALYCGYTIHNGKLYKGIHQTIIPEKTYRLATDELKLRYRYNPGKITRHLLTGFIKCGHCGYSMYLGGTKNSYRCPGYNYHKCTAMTDINRVKIENYIDDIVIGKIRNLDLDISIENELDSFKAEIEIENKIRSIEVKLERIATERAEGYMSKDIYRLQFTKYSKQLEEIKIPQKKITEYEDFPTEDIYMKTDVSGKRRIIGLFIDRIEVFSKKSTGKLDMKSRVKITFNKITQLSLDNK